MEKFTLTSTVFKADGNTPLAIGVIVPDEEQVREILEAELDTETDLFELANVSEGVWELRYLGGAEMPDPNVAFDLEVLIEYIAINGQRMRALPKFRVFGTTGAQCLPEIHHIENLASRVGEVAEVVLHCHNLTEANVANLAVFLYADGNCIRIAPEDIQYEGLSDEACSTADQTATIILTPDMFGNDEACATYSIYLGYGDTCSNATLLENSSTTRNLSLIRYKFDEDNKPATGNGDYAGEGNCWFTSPISLTTSEVGTANNDVSTGAGDGFGSEIYVKGISYDCPCENIKYYYVRLIYNTRLDYRKGEMTLDGVSLREGDIVWLAAQFDGTDGLWEVRKDDWQGLGEPVYGEGANPCFAINPPLPVDCGVFIDPGVRVNETIKVVCSDDVPVKNGSQTVCGIAVKPGDLVVLTNQVCEPGENCDGLWRVTCGDWEFLGNDFEINGNTVDLSRAVTVQTDIDFCKCGGIFHIDYYYLNSSCYLNHARRTVKVMCGGASVVPNGERQVIITDYKISDGANDELIKAISGTPGDPVLDDCVLVDENYERKFSMETTEIRKDCSYTEGDVSPDCRAYCDCERHYTVKMTDEYSASSDTNGFTIAFWQRRDDGWHLYGYVGTGNPRIGMEYYVMHLKKAGAAVADDVEYNKEVTVVELDGNGNTVKDANGQAIEHTTHDAWFIPHAVPEEIYPEDSENVRKNKMAYNRSLENILADGFGLVDDNWSFAVRNGYGEKVPMEYTSILGPDSLYDNWRITDSTKFLCNRTDDGIVGMRGVWGFRYYKTAMSAADFVKMYNSAACH